MKQFIAWILSGLPLAAATLELHHSKAELRGQAEREQANGCIAAWEDEKTIVVWLVRVDRLGVVEIECLQAAEVLTSHHLLQSLILPS